MEERGRVREGERSKQPLLLPSFRHPDTRTFQFPEPSRTTTTIRRHYSFVFRFFFKFPLFFILQNLRFFFLFFLV